jgi:hypothetical protein
MNTCRLASYLCLLVLVASSLVACGAPATPSINTPEVTETVLSPTPISSIPSNSSSPCGDEYSRPLSSSSYVPENSGLTPI